MLRLCVFLLPCMEITHSVQPCALCSCSLLASRLLFFSCAFKVLHLPRVLLIISILFIIHWSSSLFNPFRKGAEGSVIIKQGSDFCFPKSVSKSISAPKAPLPPDLWHYGHFDTVSTNADRLEKENMLVVDFFSLLEVHFCLPSLGYPEQSCVFLAQLYLFLY